MTALLRPRLPLSTDFGNAKSSTWGSRAPKPVTLARRNLNLSPGEFRMLDLHAAGMTSTSVDAFSAIGFASLSRDIDCLAENGEEIAGDAPAGEHKPLRPTISHNRPVSIEFGAGVGCCLC
jgi:hypothetical protein